MGWWGGVLFIVAVLTGLDAPEQPIAGLAVAPPGLPRSSGVSARIFG